MFRSLSETSLEEKQREESLEGLPKSGAHLSVQVFREFPAEVRKEASVEDYPVREFAVFPFPLAGVEKAAAFFPDNLQDPGEASLFFQESFQVSAWEVCLSPEG